MSEWIWEPKPEDARRTNVWRYMQKLGFSDREAFLKYSTYKLEEFWGDLAMELDVEWSRPYEHVLDGWAGNACARWFVGGQLNIAANVLERHGRSSRELTFAELQREVNRLASGSARDDMESGFDIC